MHYPQIIIPEGILEILNKKEFTKPVPPKLPQPPVKQKSLGLKFLILGIGIFIALIKSLILIGLILIFVSLVWLLNNPEEKEFVKKQIAYKKDINTYSVNLEKFHIDKEVYENSIKTSEQSYFNYKRRESVLSKLRCTKMPIFEKDYKKGISHNYFKEFLVEYFGDRIKEDATIKAHKISYYNSDYDSYIADFAYVDGETKLCIDIEIDEPYTLKDKKAIHLDDSERNNFFRNNNWIIVRFSEEQIVRYPEKCCLLIKDVIYLLTQNLNHLFKTDSSLIKTEKWTDETVIHLINDNYRQTYLDIISNPKYSFKAIKSQKFLENMMKIINEAPKPK